MNLCDPNSDPLLPCKPRSDSNAAHGSFPGGGSAFMELQFYPPGFAPFSDSIGCDKHPLVLGAQYRQRRVRRRRHLQ